MVDLSTGPRKVVFVSGAVAGTIGVLAVADLFLGYPYNPFGSMLSFDLSCLVGSVLVMLMAYDAWQELPPGPARDATVRRPAATRDGLRRDFAASVRHGAVSRRAAQSRRRLVRRHSPRRDSGNDRRKTGVSV